MTAPLTYTLTVVREDGSTHSTSVTGYYRESMCDQYFDAVVKDARTRYAVVFDGGSVRREFWRLQK